MNWLPCSALKASTGRWGRSLCIVATLWLGGGAAAQPALDSARFEAEVGKLAAPYDVPVRAFYRDRAYRPVWTVAAARSARDRDLQAAIAEVEAEGLDPSAYPMPTLFDGSSREASEVALAKLLLRVADDLARGRVSPSAVHDDWNGGRRQLDYERLLLEAASHGSAAALETVRPPHEAYARLRLALARYRSFAEGGGWPTIPPGPVLHPGDQDAAVLLLRARLYVTGDLDQLHPPGPPGLYDTVLEQAVRRAQARHGLDIDGVVGPATRAALNVTAEERAEQIALNMERWRWLPAHLGPTYLHINAAGMWLELVEDGERVLRLRTIVGTRGDPTPGFNSLVTHAVLNPYWNVPESIARSEIRPRLGRDPGYLARHHMRILPNGSIRQNPGPDNPLGPVKFIFENRFGVRLHGTSTPSLFEVPARAFSHGCIRVEEPLRLAERLIQSSAWNAERIQEAIGGTREIWIPLPSPVPLYVAYWTAWVEDDGTVQFRSDLYGRDHALGLALGMGDSRKAQRVSERVVAEEPGGRLGGCEGDSR